MTEDQRVLYQSTTQFLLNSLDQRVKENQTFLLAHSGLGTLFLSSIALEEVYTAFPSLLTIILCIAGVTLAIMWGSFSKRANKWIRFWFERLRSFEEDIVQNTYVFASQEIREMEQGQYAREVLGTSIGALAGMWIVLLLFSLA